MIPGFGRGLPDAVIVRGIAGGTFEQVTVRLGILHALRELGVPGSEFVTALLTFNVGVEAGQLAVIGAAFALVGRQYADCGWYRSRIVLPGSALIACTAAYWTLQRLSL